MAVLGMTLGYILGGYEHSFALYTWQHLSWWPLWGGYVLLFTLLLKFPYQSALLFTLGFCWGITWHLPQASTLGGGVTGTIVAKASLTDLRSKVVISNDHFGFYEASSALKVGEEGTLNCMNAYYCVVQSPSSFVSSPRSALQFISSILRQSISTWIGYRNDELQPWLHVLVLGSLQHIPREVRDDFRHTGLMHVLVISGFHISLIATILLHACYALLKLLYAAKFIPSLRYIQLQTITAMVVALFILMFALLTGMGAASQRAALSFLVVQSMAAFTQEQRTSKTLVYIASVQLAVYPLGFFSSGNLMSWFGTLVLMNRQRNNDKGQILRRVTSNFILQLVIVVGARLFFGQWAWWGLLLNLFVLDYFTCLSLAALFTLSCCVPQFIELGLAECFNDFAQMLGILHIFSENFTYTGELLGQISDQAIACLFFILLLIYGYQNKPSHDKIELGEDPTNAAIRTDR